MPLSEALQDSVLFEPLRSVYRHTLHRNSLKEVRAMRNLYGLFIRPKDVVFDVGANIGEYAEVFSRLAKTVIAFEPNPQCLKSLRKVAKRHSNIHIMESAVGDTIGTAQMNVCELNHFGTLNDQFIVEANGSEDYRGVHWSGKIDVPVITLDSMREKFGVPAFVKIDVEGFEAHVVKGMTFRPRTLSFEFSTRSKHIAFDVLAQLESYRFNAVAGRSFEFIHPEWLTHDEITRWLCDYSATQYGDIFATRGCPDCHARFGHFVNCATGLR